ncbi:N-acetylmuramoyl-L-alanine amidase [Alkalibacillus haloalkaliphilus]|uniref:N-acetylmuramoyl-L-alanine amidase n=1 Tax=Alkalibacillus haloalkaliphilus TaxID=94136 RepID=UPI0002D7AFB5|nr:N-acetylmuramoyl-L-alanine amidase [Alkalibacillus haloalkaliphilus]
MTKIYIDAGHGGNDPGAVGNGLREKDLTLEIALKTRDILNNEYEGHQIMMSRTTDVTKSLSARTSEANNWAADYFLSIHINAGGGTGFESFIYNGPTSPNTPALRVLLHDDIMSHVDWIDRGKKSANFHVLRESNMPAALTENGFIDNVSDAQNLSSDDYLNRIARGHAEGLAEAFNLSDRQNGDRVYYRVVAGSFTSRSNAENLQNHLEESGYETFLDIFTQEDQTYYRVIAGSFHVRESAQIRVDELIADGFDAFIAIYEY